jgi:ribosome-associated protein
MHLAWTPADWELDFSAIRASGPGGQNVNKVSSAVHLRFDIRRSTLPAVIKERLLALSDQRITAEGVVVIKAQESRSQEQNRADAVARLVALVQSVAHTPKTRRPTRPTFGSQQRRLSGKAQRGEVKSGRGKIQWD